MSMTAEQVVCNVLMDERKVSWIQAIAKDVVAALRREGWLRDYPNCGTFHAKCDERIATLERDLDAATKERDNWQEEARRNSLNADYWRAQSREASPAMLRVVELASRKARAIESCTLAVGKPPSDLDTMLIAAVDALAAPAVEKPETRDDAMLRVANHLAGDAERMFWFPNNEEYRAKVSVWLSEWKRLNREAAR